ncbi:alkaline phosphatase D family protein [uncultured Algimonas sp.]|uniref:alkaline phosphatase D family protein n=1 Tax=uncultured Algimonas sp. TaxID=1547920 RepID=UPI002631EB96|nr:alkaline phosphatase D family protein [uncultured Algimonas sp.]
MTCKLLLCTAALFLFGCTTVTDRGVDDVDPAPFSTGIVPMSSAALADDTVLTRIAVGSCANETEDQSIWNDIRAENPDLFLFIGDNVYGDPRRSDPRFADPAMPQMRQSYIDLSRSAPFAALRAETPVLTTWDDHDYGENDGGADYLYRDRAEALFLDAWDVPAADERRARDGVHTSRIIGPDGRRVQIILLDTRFFRTYLQATDERGAKGKERYVPLAEPHGTMLGDAQWDWLEGELEKPADLRLLVSSIQIHADGHGWEAWKMMPHERDRLYELIDGTKANDVILLSGDRHAGSIYRRDDVTDEPLYELTTSSLNVPASRWRAESGETYVEPGPHRLHTMQYEANYGLVDIDWADRAVTLTVRSPDGGDFVNRVTF